MRLGFSHSRSHPPFIAPGMSGLGLSPQTNEIASIAATGAATTGALVALIPGFALAGPVGAAVAGLIAVGIGIANLFKGCGQTCVAATNIANQLETYWQSNLDHYMSASPRYKSIQLAALNNFDTGWAAIYKACSDPSLGAAGQRCISERQRGGASPWCCNAPNSVDVGNGMCTGCDAFADFRDPITNDPSVVPDPVGMDASTVGAGGSASTTGFSFPMPLLLIGGGILLYSMVD